MAGCSLSADGGQLLVEELLEEDEPDAGFAAGFDELPDDELPDDGPEAPEPDARESVR
jgi:hypothetical protein